MYICQIRSIRQEKSGIRPVFPAESLFQHVKGVEHGLKRAFLLRLAHETADVLKLTPFRLKAGKPVVLVAPSLRSGGSGRRARFTAGILASFSPTA